jgi:hypothetical protein
MRRKKRVQIVEFPYAPPEEVRWVITEPIKVNDWPVPQPYEPAVPDFEPKKEPKKKEKAS